ncbi:hypothetical protein tb265_03300 [Gemmatimonadetes bacterium T265]|nr:hypothetical protein tb265_03300 [Gemmatimonadetes bacterium T265]
MTWDGKYDAQGRRVALPPIALPFQTVETVNESAADPRGTSTCSAAGRGPHSAASLRYYEPERFDGARRVRVRVGTLSDAPTRTRTRRSDQLAHRRRTEVQQPRPVARAHLRHPLRVAE